MRRFFEFATIFQVRIKIFHIPEGSIVRNRKHQHAYNTYRKQKTPGCQFCEFTQASEQMVDERTDFWVVRNIFPYHIWDGSRTGEHLMIVPKRHVDSLIEFNDAEQREYIALLAAYEDAGYSIYMRAPASGRKTVAHQHTHLIQVGKQIKVQLFIEKPHVNLTR